MQFIMGYEPLYHARAWRRVKPEVCLYIVCSYRMKLGVFNTTVIPFALVGYEMIVAIIACLRYQHGLVE